MYRGEITIVLKSDLCTGSGYSYAGVIDSDICYDEVGLPYIPGKRLKGCFRETADSLLYLLYGANTVSSIFGEAGNKEEGNFRVGNAYIKNYDQVKRQLKIKSHTEPSVVNSEAVLSNYSHIVGQTQISDKGAAERTTLRFTRVIDHYDPLNEGTELTFIAKVQASVNEDEKDAIEKIVRCTRNIGLKRNRGMGSVKCTITLTKDMNSEAVPDICEGEIIVVLPVVVENVEPLMLSGEYEDVSESYIKGQALLGVLAGRYLKIAGKTADDPAFYDLFLNGKVRYSNLYPYIMEQVYYPVPEYINQLKKSKKLVNVLTGDSNPEEDDDYRMENGNIPKKMKGRYARIDENMKVAVTEVKKEIVYHHSHYKKNENGETGILYGMEIVSPGQQFKGYIFTPAKYAALIKYLLKKDDLYFGKSRSSQYGRTVLLNVEEGITDLVTIDDFQGETTYKKGESAVIDFLSDTVFLDQVSGEYTVFEKAVHDAVAKTFKEKLIIKSELISHLKTGKLTGYSRIWNLRKSPIPCIKAGSSVVLEVDEDCKLPNMSFIGEHQLEGCGLIALRKLNTMHFKVDVDDAPPVNDAPTIQDQSADADKLYKLIKQDNWLRLKKKEFLSGNCPHITASGIGRITLMLKESLTESTDYIEQYRLFSKRIHSIKSDDLKAAGKNLIKIFGDGTEFTWLDTEIQDETEREEYRKLWGQCLMTTLVIWKYEKAGDDNE